MVMEMKQMDLSHAFKCQTEFRGYLDHRKHIQSLEIGYEFVAGY